jgi:hypothetical protein
MNFTYTYKELCAKSGWFSFLDALNEVQMNWQSAQSLGNGVLGHIQFTLKSYLFKSNNS